MLYQQLVILVTPPGNLIDKLIKYSTKRNRLKIDLQLFYIF